MGAAGNVAEDEVGESGANQASFMDVSRGRWILPASFATSRRWHWNYLKDGLAAGVCLGLSTSFIFNPRNDPLARVS